MVPIDLTQTGSWKGTFVAATVLFAAAPLAGAQNRRLRISIIIGAGRIGGTLGEL